MKTKRAVTTNAVIALSGQWVKLLIQVAGLVILSRILGPEKVGLVAMVTSITAIATVIGDLGLSLAAIQAKNLTQSQKSGLFWVNSMLGITIAGIIALAAPLAGSFYGRPETVIIMYWMAGVFAMQGIAVQFRVELNRAEKFGHLALIDTIGPAVGLLVAITIALTTNSYLALVFQQVITAFICLLLAVYFSRWVPGWFRRGIQLGALVNFGIFAFLTQLLAAVTTNLGTVLVGYGGTSSTAGIYNRSYQIAYMPTTQIAGPLTRVLMPQLAKSARQKKSLTSAVVRVQKTLLYGVGAPLSILAGTAGSLIPLILGTDWLLAVPITRILTVAGAFTLASYIFHWLLLATAKTKLLFNVEFGARIVMVSLMLFLFTYGAEWVAFSIAVGSLVMLLANIIFSLPRLNIERGVFLASTLKPLSFYSIASLAAWGAEAALINRISSDSLMFLLSLSAWFGTALIALIIPSVRRDMKDILILLKTAFRKRRT